jgi:hypothetical protein
MEVHIHPQYLRKIDRKLFQIASSGQLIRMGIAKDFFYPSVIYFKFVVHFKLKVNE